MKLDFERARTYNPEAFTWVIENHYQKRPDEYAREIADTVIDGPLGKGGLISISDNTLEPIRAQAHAFKEEIRSLIRDVAQAVVQRAINATEHVTLKRLGVVKD